MKVLSVNVGLPRVVEYMGEPVVTGIFKSQVEGVGQRHKKKKVNRKW